MIFVRTKIEVDIKERKVKDKVLGELWQLHRAMDQALSSFVVEGEKGHPFSHQHFFSNPLTLSLASEQTSRIPLIKDRLPDLVGISMLFPMKLKCLGRSEAPKMPQQII